MMVMKRKARRKTWRTSAIADLCEMKGWSLQDLRDALKDEYGVKKSPSTLHDWGNPEKPAKPDADSLRAFVLMSGRPLDWFYE